MKRATRGGLILAVIPSVLSCFIALSTMRTWQAIRGSYRKNPNLVLVNEPFFVDDELRKRITKWVEWANQADPKDYDPMYELLHGGEPQKE